MVTDGFITERAYASSDVLGLDISNLTSVLSSMAESYATKSSFSVTFTPQCIGNITGEIYFNSDTFGGAVARIPVKAEVIGNDLPYCSKDNPVITVTSTPENAIQTGNIKGMEGSQKYIDFDNLGGEKTVTITASSDTYLAGGYTETSTGIFSANIRAWTLSNNEVTAKATITYDTSKCTGPASERFHVNGLDGTSGHPYLYVIGMGTAVDGIACSNRYPLQTD